MSKKTQIEESEITPEVVISEEKTPKVKTKKVIGLGEIGGKKIVSSVDINDREKRVVDIAGATFIVPIE